MMLPRFLSQSSNFHTGPVDFLAKNMHLKGGDASLVRFDEEDKSGARPGVAFSDRVRGARKEME
jgi:hypothetical protein